jgi:hypothetical protein
MQRDYIMRSIEQIAALLASVVATRQAGQGDRRLKSRTTLPLEQCPVLRLTAVPENLA